jgi:hypothetical protein
VNSVRGGVPECTGRRPGSHSAASSRIPRNFADEALFSTDAYGWTAAGRAEQAPPTVSGPACRHWLSQKRKSLRSRTRGPGVLTETHRKRILRRDCSRQLLVAPPKTPTAATQVSSHFLADDRPAETAAELLASLLTRSTEDFVARLAGAARSAARLVAELLLRLTEDRRAAVKRPG